MKLFIKRAAAASIPLALLAGSALGAGAAQFGIQPLFQPFGLRAAATGPAVLGGGATLPVPAYLGKSVAGKYEGSGVTSFGVAGSIFGFFATQSGGLNVEYCATGSGKGKGVFDGPANTVDIACANAGNPNATTFGFLPPSGSPRQTYPTLAGTDAPLAQADYNSYLSGHPAPMEPVELPSVFGSIAIYYNDPKLPTSISRITLTDTQICQVYTGAITRFSQITGNSADTTAIRPVYRLDGSGTSFNFSNHLATICHAPFNGNQTFFPNADPSLPATKVGGTGNGGVIAAVQATAGGFGYVEVGYLAAVTLTHSNNYANVRNGRSGGLFDPVLGLPAAANTIPASSLQTNVQVIQGAGPATTGHLTGVRSGNCVKVIPPAAYANPSTGYPIVAVTYLLTNSARNGSQIAIGLRNLERILTTPSLFKHPGATTPITTVDEAEPAVSSGTTGYSSLGSTFSSTIQATANACINV
jgi:phosphate transport system substrate-binding protein